jgi:formate dehydrogenase beta subunit
MEDLIFSSWGGQVVNNRQLPRERWNKAEQVDLPVAFVGEDVQAFMGWNGVILRDDRVDIVDLTREYLVRVQGYSCGRCVPCRVGTRVMLEAVQRVVAGKSAAGELDRLAGLGRDIMAGSKCEIGRTSPLPVLQALEHFRQDFLDVGAGKRTVRPGNYRSHLTAPCMDDCPAHLDVPTYIENIKERRFEQSLALIRERNALPGVCGRVCVRPCEFKCRRNTLDEPVQIKFLKRFVTDYEWQHDLKPVLPAAAEKHPDLPVAVIGAGPAGLACAYYLGLQGFPVTIFEDLPEAGGMAAVGIPDYRLPRPALDREVQLIEQTGARIVYHTRIGRDKKIADLWQEGFKAIFVASGSHESRPMMVEGEKENYQGFIHGVKFLRDINLGHEVYRGQRVVVVGGGNVAIDCARSALRMGYSDVNLVYRRTRKEMPADIVEIEDAEKEGVKFHFLTLPVRIMAEGGRVKAVQCIRMELGEPDASGRRAPVSVPGSEFIMESDVVIPAIGQSQDLDFLKSEPGVVITRSSTVKVDENSLMSDGKGIFSGGDCVSGPFTLINALAAGYDAAIAIEQYLQGKPPKLPDFRMMEKLVQSFKLYSKEEKVTAVAGVDQSEMAALPVATRIHTFEEVEAGFTPAEAIREANRCLRCYRVAVIASKTERGT